MSELEPWHRAQQVLALGSWHVALRSQSPPQVGASALSFLAFVASSALVLLALKEPREEGWPERGMDGLGLGLVLPNPDDECELASGRGRLPSVRTQTDRSPSQGSILKFCLNPWERHNSCLLREILSILCKHNVSEVLC